MNHTLKTDPEPFDAVKAGRKTFEIRLNDRGYQEGDILILRKTRHSQADMSGCYGPKKPLEYTGDALEAEVTHMLTGPVYGLADGWVILSIDKPIDVSDHKFDKQ